MAWVLYQRHAGISGTGGRWGEEGGGAGGVFYFTWDECGGFGIYVNAVLSPLLKYIGPGVF